MQLLKGNSSKWLNEEFPRLRPFSWQEGYGAFSIGASQVDKTIAYIAGQQEHHRGRSFEDEFLAILEKYEIPFDPRYVFDSEIAA